MTVSPTLAVTVFGLNARAPFPTSTWVLAADTEVAAATMARVAEARVKRILKFSFFSLSDVRANRKVWQG